MSLPADASGLFVKVSRLLWMNVTQAYPKLGHDSTVVTARPILQNQVRILTQQSERDETAVREAIEDLEGLAESAMGGAEGLHAASCPPAARYLAEIGIGAAARGCSRAGWRTQVADVAALYTFEELDEAEACMRHSGLWPWP